MEKRRLDVSMQNHYQKRFISNVLHQWRKEKQLNKIDTGFFSQKGN